MSTAVKKGKTVMTEGVIWKQVLLFAIPLMLTNLLQQLYNTVDSIIVGQYIGKIALAAVGSTGQITNLFIGFFVGVSTGAGVVVSQAYGAKNNEKLHKAVHTAVALSILAGILLGIIGVVFAPHILTLTKTPADVFDSAVRYLRIIFGGIIFTTVYNIGAGILRAIGDSKRPLYYLAVCAVMNVALNLLFVVAFNMGVDGVAWATIIAQAVSAVLVLIRLIRTKEVYKLVVSSLTIDTKQLKEIIRIGIPAGMQSVVMNLSNVIIQSFVNAEGSTIMAGFAAAARIDAFIYMPISALALTATTFTGQNIGAKQFDRVRKGSKTCILLSASITFVFGITAASVSEFLISLLNSDPGVVAYGGQFVKIFASTYFIFGIAEAMSGTIRGAGVSTPPMIISLITLCALRVIYLFIFVPIIDNIHVITFCYPISWIANAAVFSVYYFKGNWLKKHEKALKEA